MNTPDTSTAAVFRQALRDMLLLLGVLTVLGVGIGYLVAGSAGVWGALIGVGIALVFSGTTVLSMLATENSGLNKMAIVVMGSWLVKVVVVVVVLAILRDMTFYSRGVLLAVVSVGVIGSALLDYRAVGKGHVPYVEPSSPQPVADEEDRRR